MEATIMPGRPRFKGDPEYRPSDAELSWVAEHQEEAAGWVREDRFLGSALVVTFVVGLAINLLGYGMAKGVIPVLLLPTDLAAELIGNLGIIMWTSVVVVIFIEVIPERERRRAVRYMAGVRSALRDQGRALPDPPDGAVEATAGEGTASAELQLDRILSRLTAIERTLDERLPGRAADR
ncbi:MAG TPA: hypothetical protein VLR93_10375 [Patescibacteria group bacterium]|nr:hypothetical protein [Patescibacteria group bacterium]